MSSVSLGDLKLPVGFAKAPLDPPAVSLDALLNGSSVVGGADGAQVLLLLRDHTLGAAGGQRQGGRGEQQGAQNGGGELHR